MQLGFEIWNLVQLLCHLSQSTAICQNNSLGFQLLPNWWQCGGLEEVMAFNHNACV